METAAAKATYQINTSGTQETLCGTLLRTERPSEEAWISTIGGLIEVDGKFFAVTSSHHPCNTESTSDEDIPDSISGSPGSSVANTLIAEDLLDADMEPALIIDNWRERVTSVGDLPSESVLVTKPPQPINPFFWPDLASSAEQGSDWCLLPVGEELQLPNSIPIQQSGEDDVQTVQILAPGNRRDRKYLKSYTTELSKKVVYILAGMSGVCPGLLSSNVSFLRLRDGKSRVVWSVKLDAGFGKSLN